MSSKYKYCRQSFLRIKETNKIKCENLLTDKRSAENKNVHEVRWVSTFNSQHPFNVFVKGILTF
jgi:hypothetical protein